MLGRTDFQGLINKSPVVVKISRKANDSTVNQIRDAIQECGIQTKFITNLGSEKYVLLYAAQDKLLALADEAELIKKTVTGTMQKFNANCISDFLLRGMTEDDIVLNCESLLLIKDLVKPVILSYMRKGVIEDLFPLHDSTLKDLKYNYVHPAKSIEGIRNYFGSSIGMYFAFMEYYTKALFLPVTLGFFLYFFQLHMNVVLIFFIMWSTSFLILWKRKCATYAYHWGTIEMTSLDKPRSSYEGITTTDPITGKLTKYSPMFYTYMQMYCISYPTILLCIFAAGYFALYQFKVEAEFLADFGGESWLLYIPAIVESLLISIFSWAYEKLATFLTDRENHRTRLQYDRHRVNKLMLFEIVNNFFPLLYIAFGLRDMGQLRYQHKMQFVIFQIVTFAQEIGLPLLPVIQQKLHKLRQRKTKEDDIEFERCLYESGLAKYQSTYEDYLQLCLQFGYVVLFAVVDPFFVPLGALLNNVFSLRSDLYKLCKIYKRPFARRNKNIGAWYTAFILLSIMATLTNCGLLYLQPEAMEFFVNYFPSMPSLAFVVFEHLLLGLQFLIYVVIHEKPRWVRIALLKAEYESGEALKQIKKSKLKEN